MRPVRVDLNTCAGDEPISILDASRIPTSPSRNDAQASCLEQGGEGAKRGTKRGAAVFVVWKEDEDEGVGIGGGGRG